MKRLKKYLIAGLMVIIPLFLTIYLLVFVFQLLDGFLGNSLNAYIAARLGFPIPGLGLILSLILVLMAGFLATRYAGKKLIKLFDNWLGTLPLIKNIYPGLKELVEFLLAQKQLNFKKVVLVEYPSKGIWSVGFLTNDNHAKINALLGEEMVSVYVPNTPGPIGGYVIFVPKDKVKFPDISVSEAFKIIVSGGVFNINGQSIQKR